MIIISVIVILAITICDVIMISQSSKRSDLQFEAVKGNTGFAYEVSNHMVSGNIPQTFILVDTSNGETECLSVCHY